MLFNDAFEHLLKMTWRESKKCLDAKKEKEGLNRD